MAYIKYLPSSMDVFQINYFDSLDYSVGGDIQSVLGSLDVVPGGQFNSGNNT